jgi:hypothetical protein
VAGPVAPFTTEHVVLGREALALLARAKDLMAKAKKCGAPCEQDQAMADALQQALEGYRDEFLEPRPEGN